MLLESCIPPPSFSESSSRADDKGCFLAFPWSRRGRLQQVLASSCPCKMHLRVLTLGYRGAPGNLFLASSIIYQPAGAQYAVHTSFSVQTASAVQPPHLPFHLLCSLLDALHPTPRRPRGRLLLSFILSSKVTLCRKAFPDCLNEIASCHSLSLQSA